MVRGLIARRDAWRPRLLRVQLTEPEHQSASTPKGYFGIGQSDLRRKKAKYGAVTTGKVRLQTPPLCAAVQSSH